MKKKYLKKFLSRALIGQNLSVASYMMNTWSSRTSMGPSKL
jgi:hypothetical protein